MEVDLDALLQEIGTLHMQVVLATRRVGELETQLDQAQQRVAETTRPAPSKSLDH